MMRTKRIWAIIGISVLLASGCGNGRNEFDGTQPYEADGYLGLSNSNPNLRTHTDHHNYAADELLMRDALRGFPIGERSTILIDGADAYVTVRVPNTIRAEGRAKLLSDIGAQLSSWVPRYRYHVTAE